MQVIEKIQSPFSYEIKLPDKANLTPVTEQIDIVNNLAEAYGFSKVEFDIETRSLSINYMEKETVGVGCLAAIARTGKNTAMENALYRLVCMCNVLLTNPELTTMDGRHLPCIPIEHIVSFSNVDKNIDRDLFDKNINLFLENTEEILSDSRKFLTPVFCGKTCFFDGIPTLGVYVEFWQKCKENSIVENDLPICFMSGNPMTGSHCCCGVSPEGEIVKAKLHIRFIDLLKLFAGINSRYKAVREVCQAYTLQEIVSHLKRKKQ